MEEKITVRDVAAALEEFAPRTYAEGFDNTGLLVGEPQTEVTGILVAHDCLEEVVAEAQEKGCNLIVAFHPIIFSGLKSLTGRSYVERAVMRALRAGIAIYAVHTALDNAFHGVSAGMCDALGLQHRRVLDPQKDTLRQLTTYVPTAYAERLREALFAAGAGRIAPYEACSFNAEGTGTFRALDGAAPFVGEIGELHREAETMVRVVFLRHLQGAVVRALQAAHPYQMPAYEITTLENGPGKIGMGMIGTLEQPMSEMDFLHLLRERFDARGIRYSAPTGRRVGTVAVLGGAGSFALSQAIAQGADAYVSADFKYHDFFGAEGRILIADIGHFESERFTKNILHNYFSSPFIGDQYQPYSLSAIIWPRKN